MEETLYTEHIAGPMIGLVQKCVRCGAVIENQSKYYEPLRGVGFGLMKSVYVHVGGRAKTTVVPETGFTPCHNVEYFVSAGYRFIRAAKSEYDRMLRLAKTHNMPVTVGYRTDQIFVRINTVPDKSKPNLAMGSAYPSYYK